MGINKVIMIYPWGNKNVCTKSCANTSSRFWDISLDKCKPWPAGGTKWELRRSPKSSGFIIWEPWIATPSFMVVQSKNVKTFHQTQRYQPPGGKVQGITQASGLLPMGTMNFCTEFHGNPSSCCEDISAWPTDWQTNITILRNHG